MNLMLVCVMKCVWELIDRTSSFSTLLEIIEYKSMSSKVKLSIASSSPSRAAEPEVGRRFKGNIWMQGKINFSD